jgi:SAM-dependent methyltransferase
MAERWPHRRVVGVDIADAFISYARGQHRRGGPAFEVGDACALNYDDGAFAGAAAQLLLLFVPRPELAVHEMRRVTRSGGRVVAAVWDSRGGLVFQRMLWDTAVAIDPQARQVRDRLFAHPLAIPGGLAALFRSTGLDQVETGSLTIRMDFVDFADYWEPLLGGQGPVGTYFTALDQDLRDRIRAAVRDAYCSGASDGPRSLTATAWAVRGTVP